MSETEISQGAGANGTRTLRIFFRAIPDGPVHEVLHSYPVKEGVDVRDSDCDQALERWNKEGVEVEDFVIALQADDPKQPISVTPDDLNNYVVALYGL